MVKDGGTDSGGFGYAFACGRSSANTVNYTRDDNGHWLTFICIGW